LSFETVNTGSKGTISTQIKTVDVSKISKAAALVKDFPAVVPRCWNIHPTGIVVPMLT